MKWSEHVSGYSTTDFFLKNFGAFLTQKLWWIPFTYNEGFLVLLSPQLNTTTYKYTFKLFLHKVIQNNLNFPSTASQREFYYLFFCFAPTSSGSVCGSVTFWPRMSPSDLDQFTLFDSYGQCCGSGMIIPDPDFYLSRIPDLGSRIRIQLQKRGVKKICCHTFFYSHKFNKIVNNFMYEMLNRKNLGQFSKNYWTFYSKNCH